MHFNLPLGHLHVDAAAKLGSLDRLDTHNTLDTSDLSTIVDRLDTEAFPEGVANNDKNRHASIAAGDAKDNDALHGCAHEGMDEDLVSEIFSRLLDADDILLAWVTAGDDGPAAWASSAAGAEDHLCAAAVGAGPDDDVTRGGGGGKAGAESDAFCGWGRG